MAAHRSGGKVHGDKDYARSLNGPRQLKWQKALTHDHTSRVEKFVEIMQKSMFAHTPLPPAHCKPHGGAITPGNPKDIQAIADHFVRREYFPCSHSRMASDIRT